MSVSVRLPTVLRPFANGEKSVASHGATVGDVVVGLVDNYPGMKPNLFDGDGLLHRFVNVYVNDEDVRYLESMDTQLVDGDEISILPAVAGG
jgi:molybdopterin synthase sulfur carrier subunit